MAEGHTATSRKDLLCVGAFAAAKGLRGELRVKSFTADIKALAGYGPLTDETGTKTFEIKVVGQHKGMLVVRVKGVSDRDAAEALQGQTLYVERSRLPVTEEDEYYFSDLLGLRAELTDGAPFGEVVEAEDFGGGPFLELATPDFGRVLVPFTKACVPVVDIQGGRIVIDPPDGLLEPGEPEPQGEGS